MKISGTFSKVKFEGEIVGRVAECLRIKVENPARSLPVGNTLDGMTNILTIHPDDRNVVIG